MLQLLVSAAVLVIVVTVKFTMPDVAQQYGGELLRLMGEDTDFVAAFSAAGRAIGGDDLAEAVNDACAAVFGTEKVTVSHQTDRNAVVYGDGTTPEIVDMLQQVLNFSYQKPVEATITSAFGFPGSSGGGLGAAFTTALIWAARRGRSSTPLPMVR